MPESILAAAVAMLTPYCEDISPTKLVGAIQNYEAEDGSDASSPVPMLTKKEVCAILKISQPTLNRMLARGELSYTKVGKGVRIRADEIERVMGK